VLPCADPMSVSVSATIENSLLSTLADYLPETVDLEGDTITYEFAVTADDEPEEIPVPIFYAGYDLYGYGFQCSVTAPLDISIEGVSGDATITAEIGICLSVTGVITYNVCGKDLYTCEGDQAGTWDNTCYASCTCGSWAQCICYWTDNINWLELMGNPPYEILEATASFDCPAADPIGIEMSMAILGVAALAGGVLIFVVMRRRRHGRRLRAQQLELTPSAPKSPKNEANGNAIVASSDQVSVI